MDVEITTMSQKGQVVIPQTIRSSLKLKKGTKLLVYAHKDMLIMKPFELPRLELGKAEAASIGMFLDIIKKVRK